MASSVFSEAVEAAFFTADKQGHKMGRLWVKGTAARCECTQCGNGFVVLFHTPIATLGTALDKACEFGEANVAPADAPKPPTGQAKPLPRAAKARKQAPTMPAYDDVPFPVDMPAMVGR